MRLYGVDATSAYFLHTGAQQSMVLEDVDSVVVVWLNAPETTLVDELREGRANVYVVGDALCARTCEEAIFEALQVGSII